MKKPLHLPVLILGGLLAAGVVFVLFSPAPRRTVSVSVPQPGPAPMAGRVSLLLGVSPAGASERSGLSEFSFGEKIYATAAIEEVEPGDHVLAFRWINPRGGVQETFGKSFSSPGGSYRGWSWLELRGDEWLAFPLGPLGPGRFLGRWQVEVELDGVFLARSDFVVR